MPQTDAEVAHKPGQSQLARKESAFVLQGRKKKSTLPWSYLANHTSCSVAVGLRCTFHKHTDYTPSARVSGREALNNLVSAEWRVAMV